MKSAQPLNISSIRLSRLHDELLTDRAERDLSQFMKQAWPVIEPATEFLPNWHIDAISEYLMAVTAGQITRLLINMPPRHMKSIAVSVMWPCWEWIHKPANRWMFASYSAGLATDLSLSRRTIIQSDWYLSRWGNRFKMAKDANLKTEFRNNFRGVMMATGFLGTATGKGGDRVVIDDPHDPQQAESDVLRERGVRVFRQKFTTRLNNKKRGAIIVVMQRLHEEDVSAVCQQLGYTHLRLPAETEQRTIITLPISGREIIRNEGDLLWPEREGPKEIAEAKITLGSYGYAGQYQQRPSPPEGGMLKRQWWRFWCPKGELGKYPPVEVRLADGTMRKCPVVELPDNFEEQQQSWDMAFKDTKSSDYVVGQVWARLKADRFLLDQKRDKLNFPDTVKAVRTLTIKWPKTYRKLVEDKANGPAVIAALRKEISGLIAVNPEGGKASRVAAAAPTVESGNVYLPHPHMPGYEWVDTFIDECAAFPNAKNDDSVDTFTQAQAQWQKGGHVGVTILGSDDD